MPKPAPCSLELASPYPLPPVFTGGTGGMAYPPPACALPYAPGLAFGTCGTAPPPCGAPARGSPYGVGVCPHPPAFCGGACCHPPPPYRHHTRASRRTVSLSIFPTHRARPHPVTDVARASNASTRARTVDADDAHPSNASLSAPLARLARSRTCCGGACCHPPPPPPGGCIARVVRVTRDDGASDPSCHHRASVYYNTFLHRLKSIRIGGFRAQFGQHAHTHPNPSPARGRPIPRTRRRASARPTDGRGEYIRTRPLAPLARTPRAVSSIHAFIHSCGPPRGVASRAHPSNARIPPPRCHGARSRPPTRASGRVKFYPPLDRPRSARRWTRTKPWTADDDFIATAVERYPG